VLATNRSSFTNADDQREAVPKQEMGRHLGFYLRKTDVEKERLDSYVQHTRQTQLVSTYSTVALVLPISTVVSGVV